jgi:hypothetical protein
MNANRSALQRPIRSALTAAVLAGWAGLASPAIADVSTTPTEDPALLAAALHPTGLTIETVTIRKGIVGQVGTYRDFIAGPVTIHNGIVISSGNVANMGPLPEAQLPGYDPASPPSAINSQMDTTGDGNTSEFDTYGLTAGNIENFQGSFDVAALRVRFTLDAASAVKFDFIFGSVEFPVYTGSFTDSFLVFLDGTDPSNQITFDFNGNAVQVGSSFAGLETTADLNTAFASPHALIHHLTTTTAVLSAGTHTLIFEVGDVNDHVLDSAAFIANLRAEAGNPGTEPSDDCAADLGKQGGLEGHDNRLDNNDFVVFIDLFFQHEEDADLGKQGGLEGHDGAWDNNDFVVFIDLFFNGCH